MDTLKASSSDNIPKVRASFAKGLFHGRIEAEQLAPFEETTSEDILRMTLDTIEKFGKTVDVDQIEKEGAIPLSVRKDLAEMGLFGLVIPEEYGGFGFGTLAYIEALSALSMIDTSMTAMIGAHQSIGLKALLMFGNEDQKQKYLPLLATGEKIAAFALTEPGAGSDVRSMKTQAELSEDKSHYRLNGEKIWITNGGIASFFTVFARTTHVQEDGTQKERVTCFIVDREMDGLSTGPEEKKMGLLGSSTTTVNFDQVKVPVDNVIGIPGEGFKIAMAVLNNGRIGLAGACAFGSKKLIQQAMEHATQRRQFGKTLSEFGIIKSKFSLMLSETYAAESLARYTAQLMDSGASDYGIETAICKVFSTEAEWRTVNECLQIAGGTGYMKEYGYEKTLRDSRIFTIWEGANEVLRLFIGLSGLQGPGEQLKEVSRALKEPLKDVLFSIGVISDFGVRWIQRKVKHSKKFEGVHTSLETYSRSYERLVLDFSGACEHLLRSYGKDILNQQWQVKRVADITVDLFAIAVTFARASQRAESLTPERADHELSLAKLFFKNARRRVRSNLRRIHINEDPLEERIADEFFQSQGFAEKGYFN